MYAALTLVTLLALVITVTKIKVVEAIEGTPDPRISTFKPLKQKTDTIIMYTGIIKEKPIQRHYYYTIFLATLKEAQEVQMLSVWLFISYL